MKKHFSSNVWPLTVLSALACGSVGLENLSADELVPIVTQIQVSEIEGSSGNANNLNRYDHVLVGTPNISVAGNRAD